MNLITYINSLPKNKQSQMKKALAAHLELTPGAIRNWLNNNRLPSIKNARKIEKYLKNKVTLQELRPDIFDM